MNLFETEDMQDDGDEDGTKALEELKKSDPEAYAKLLGSVEEEVKSTEEVKVKIEPGTVEKPVPSTKLDFWSSKKPAPKKKPEENKRKRKKESSEPQPNSEALQQAKDDKKKLVAESKESAVARFVEGSQMIQKDMCGLWDRMVQTNKKRTSVSEDDELVDRLDLLLPLFAQSWKKNVKQITDADKAFTQLCTQIMGKKWQQQLTEKQYKELMDEMGKTCMNALVCFFAFVNVKGNQQAIEALEFLEELAQKTGNKKQKTKE